MDIESSPYTGAWFSAGVSVERAEVLGRRGESHQRRRNELEKKMENNNY